MQFIFSPWRAIIFGEHRDVRGTQTIIQYHWEKRSLSIKSITIINIKWQKNSPRYWAKFCKDSIHPRSASGRWLSCLFGGFNYLFFDKDLCFRTVCAPYSTLFVFGYTGVFGISWPRSMPGLFILPNRHVTTPFFIPNDNESLPFDETALN